MKKKNVNNVKVLYHYMLTIWFVVMVIVMVIVIFKSCIKNEGTDIQTTIL